MNLNDIANKYLNEEYSNDTVKIFYADLDLPARKKILDAIDNANENIDVYGDDIILNKIEEELKNKPIIMINGKELTNKMNFNF